MGDTQIITDEATIDKIESLFITDGTRHSIPLDEIINGCFGKDCIPSIDDPEFTSVGDLPSWFDEDGIGISIDLNGEQGFYPYQVLVGHEIVNNDRYGNQPVLVTYCPLCFSGIVFDPTVNGEVREFGVSGKLWNSNLLMYDRVNESLWSQISGEAVVGEQTGDELALINSDITTYKQWAAQNPDGKVLIGDKGSLRSYSFIPYGGDLTDIPPFFPLNNTDQRLTYNAFVHGIEFDGQTKAYHVDAIMRDGEVTDTFAGRTIVARYDESLGTARLFERKAEGTEERLDPFTAFWFSWVAVHPETELYK